MQGLTTNLLHFRIRQKWIREGLSEILSTFILAVAVYGTGAQYTLTQGDASAVTGRALGGAAGLMLAIYAGWKSSGALVNPNLSLLFCLVGKLKWRKYPLYVVSELIGAFLAACVVYFVYHDLIDHYEGGQRTVVGANATAGIFVTFPHPLISRSTAFVDVVMGTSLLLSSILAITDPNNANTHSGLIPIAFAFMLFVVLTTFGVNTGAAINPGLDMAGRFLLVIAGYGSEVFSHADYWFWVPIVGGATAALISAIVYPFMVGNHLAFENDDEITEVSLSVIENGSAMSEKQQYQSQASVTTISTLVDSLDNKAAY